MEQEYIVSLKEGVDYEKFWFEMETNTPNGVFIPDRAVDIVDERLGSKRCCHYSLTDYEAETLKRDQRVLDVELHPKLRTDIEVGFRLEQTGNFTKTSLSSGNYLNWGLLRCTATDNFYGTGSSYLGRNYPYHLDGTGVDVVISDSGLQVDHPEFTNAAGASRVQLIDWYAASGNVIAGTQNANHYRDMNGHGTHVAGIASGKNYGWAKGAQIYSVKVYGLEGGGDVGTGISITNSQDVIKLWHLAKPVDPTTGLRRPTVVNMSWGYSSVPGTITSGNYRGTAWTATDANSNTATLRKNNYGIQSGYRIPLRQSWLDTDIEEMLAAGIIICIAAGNSPYKADLSTGNDYNNYLIDSGGTRYYHRGSSPFSGTKGCFMVGNIDATPFSASQERAVLSSTRGPATTIWAPGTNIVSSTSNTNAYSGTSYHLNSNYKQVNIGGTSMASPQICGMVALYLQVNPGATPQEAWNFMVNNSQSTIRSTGLDNDWSDSYSLHGSPARVAFMPFAVSEGVRNTAKITGASLKR